MSVKIFKKKATSKRLLASMLIVVIPFALSSALSGMDHGDTSKEHQASKQSSRSSEVGTTITPQLDESIVDRKIKRDMDMTVAMGKVRTYVRYMSIKNAREEITNIIPENIRKSKKIKNETNKDINPNCAKYLREEAWEIFRSNIFNNYVNELLDIEKESETTIKHLTEKNKYQNEQFEILLEENKYQKKQIEILLEKVAALKKENELPQKNHQYTLSKQPITDTTNDNPNQSIEITNQDVDESKPLMHTNNSIYTRNIDGGKNNIQYKEDINNIDAENEFYSNCCIMECFLIEGGCVLF